MNFLRTAARGVDIGKALLRLDFNTKDDWRMEASRPTLDFLLQRAEKLIVVSHRGRPKGAERALSLRSDARDLSRLVGRPVVFIPTLDFKAAKKVIDSKRLGTVFLLENLRFHKGEADNSDQFARGLASLADIYVNDAFAVCHRDAASVVAITRHVPSYAGFELETEVAVLSKAMRHPVHPLVVVLGGGKAHDKMGVIRNFRRKARWFLLGGAAANTMMKLKGEDIGDSLVDKDAHDAKEFRGFLKWDNLRIPQDVRRKDGAILDIGRATIKDFSAAIALARTIIWSGPMGRFETRPFDRGTLAIAKAIADNKKAFTIAGGGETVMFLKSRKLDKKFDFISTGGSAMLEFLAGERLPGVEALRRRRPPR